MEPRFYNEHKASLLEVEDIQPSCQVKEQAITVKPKFQPLMTIEVQQMRLANLMNLYSGANNNPASIKNGTALKPIKLS